MFDIINPQSCPELPFDTFLMLMQPIHLAIGVVEGLVTAAVVSFIWQARPEIIEKAAAGAALGRSSVKKVLAGLAILAMMTGGIFSVFASTNPDGLEWSVFNASGKEALETSGGIYQTLAAVQEKMTFLPDYSFKNQPETNTNAVETKEAWPAVDAGTSVSGLVGGVMTLMLAGMTGCCIYWLKKRHKTGTV